MKAFKVFLLVALVFLAGVVSGVVGTRMVVRRIVGEVIAHPETVQPHIERGLALRLRLNGEQRKQLHEILSNTHEKLETLRKEFRPQVITVLSNADEQITGMLMPEQLARYEAWKEQNRPLIQALKEKH